MSFRYYRLAKEGVWIIAGQISAILGTVVLIRVLTEYLDPVQYGQVALGLTVAGIVDQVVMGGLSNGVSRFYSIATERQQFGGYIAAARWLMGYATLVVAAISLVFLAVLAALEEFEWMKLAAAALLFSVLSTYNGTFSGLQNAARKRATVALHSGADVWLKILLAVAVMQWLGTSSAAAVLGYALSSLLVTVSQYFFFRRLIPPSVTRGGEAAVWIRQIWAYSWPFSTWGVFTWAQLSSDRWALEAFASSEEVGLYAVLFQLGYAPIGLATGMAMSFIGPILYQRSGDATSHARNSGVHRLAWQITISCLVLTLLAFVMAMTLHGWIFRLAVAAEFRSVSYLLPWIVVAGGLFAAAQMLALKLLSDMKSSAMITAKIVTAILGIALNIYGAAIAGLNGIVVSAVVFGVLYFLWMWRLSMPRVAPSMNIASR